MSRARLALLAAASAALGGGTGFLLSTRVQQQQQQKQQQQQSKSPESESGIITIPSPSAPSTEPVIATPRGLPVQRPVSTTTTTILKPLAVSGPVNPTGILKYGNPGPVADELSYLPFYGAYDRRTRNPSWVAEHITPESAASTAGIRRNNFTEDKRIPTRFRARLADYSGSGYDRGHLVPAADAKWSQEAMDDTFKLTNMCPQVGDGFNRHYWARLEDFCRNLTTRYPSVRVISGPLYLPHRDEDGKWRVSYEVVGNPPNVAVPTHFYKIIFGEHTADDGTATAVAVGAFVLPNARIDSKRDLKDFEVELDVVERASGLEFAKELEPEVRRRLCEEVRCDLTINNFSQAVTRAAAKL